MHQLSAALADRYRIERELGQGGMATVYLAQDLKHDRHVALKVLRPELAAVIGADRFLAEIKTTANLQHPHILPLFDSGVVDGTVFYVMPFVEGETLRDLIAREKQLAVPEAVRIATEVASALDYAHRKGVIHRDIKPENILLHDGRALVADFGIALTATSADSRMTETGMSLGTPHYMSPEQAMGERNLDARTDVYALGCVLYEMLTGEPPFTGPTAQAIVAKVITAEPVPASTYRKTVPSHVEQAVTMALAKLPADRFSSCGAFGAALASGPQTVAQTSGAGGRTTPSSSRPARRLASVAALLAVAAIVVAGITFARRSEAVDAAPPPSEQSLAVLPFTSVGGDTANTYFAAGIADELTSALSRIPGLRLAGRAAAARVKQQGDAVGDIGTALNVSAVLDGSVRRAGERIRVVAELTSAADGRVLWSETYERALEDVFAVQDDITRSIVGALQVRLAGGDAPGSRSARGGTTNLAAYDHYLRALERYRERGAGLIDAERSVMAAVDADPKYAKAHALLAVVLLVQPNYLDIDASTVQRRARAAALRAVALDDSLADGHLALGHVYTESFEWVEAERELRRAIALDPRSIEAHYRLAETLITLGRLREAQDFLEETQRLDPLYPVAAGYLGWTSSMRGQHDEAINESTRALALDPQNVTLNWIHCMVLDAAGRHDQAGAQARVVLRMTTDPARVGFVGWVLARAGAKDEARAILRQLEAMPRGTRGRALGLMSATLGLGDFNGTLDALEDAVVEAPQRLVATGIVSPRFDPLRAEPRFAAVLRKLNLPVELLTLPDGGRSR